MDTVATTRHSPEPQGIPAWLLLDLTGDTLDPGHRAIAQAARLAEQAPGAWLWASDPPVVLRRVVSLAGLTDGGRWDHSEVHDGRRAASGHGRPAVAVIVTGRPPEEARAALGGRAADFGRRVVLLCLGSGSAPLETSDDGAVLTVRNARVPSEPAGWLAELANGAGGGPPGVADAVARALEGLEAASGEAESPSDLFHLELRPPEALIDRLGPLRRLLRELHARDRRPVWLWGEGGSGKSVLLGTAARMERGRWEAVVAVEVRRWRSPEAIVAALAEAAGREEPPAGATLAERVGAAAAALPCPRLLVLDDLGPYPEDGDTRDGGAFAGRDGTVKLEWKEVLGALAALPDTAFVVSSRVRPRFPEDRPGSEMEGWELMELGEFDLPEAVVYLERLLGSLSDPIPAEELRAVLGKRVGTHPLTLSLLAGAIEREGWAAVRDDPELTRATARKRFLDQLWEAVAADEATRRLAHALALLEVPVPGAVLRGLADGDGEALEQLRRWSALEQLEAGDEVWTGPHPVIHDDWAARTREALDEAGRRDLAGELAEALREAGTGRRSAELHAEAVRLFLDAGHTEAACELLEGGLAEALHRLGLWHRRAALLQRLVADPTLHEARRAAALRELGRTYQHLGRLDEAEELSRRSLEIRERLGDQGGIAKSLHQLGILAYLQGRLDEAEELYRRSLEISERLGDQDGIATSLHQLGNLEYLQGRLGEAEELYRRSLEIAERLGNPAGMAVSIGQLGILAQAQGRLDEAEELYRRSLEISERLGDQDGIATSLHQLGRLAQDQGRLDEAEELYRRSLEIAERLGDQGGIATSLHQLGILAQAQGRLDEAEELYRRSLEISERLGDPAGMAASIGQLAVLAERRGDREAALAGHGKAEELYLRSGREPDAAFARYHIARLLAKEGRDEHAARAAALSFAVLAGTGDARWELPARLLVEVEGRLGEESLREAFRDALGSAADPVWAAYREVRRALSGGETP